MSWWDVERVGDGWTLWVQEVAPITRLYFATADGPDGMVEPVALHGACRTSPDVALHDLGMREAQAEVLGMMADLPEPVLDDVVEVDEEAVEGALQVIAQLRAESSRLIDLDGGGSVVQEPPERYVV